MVGRAVIALSVFFLVASPVLAEDCPVLEFEKIEKLLSGAPSCDRAMALFEACSFGSSGDVGLGQIVSKKCESLFLNKLSKSARRVYDGKIQACWDKHAKQSGTMYRSMSAFCAAAVAQAYAARARKAKR